MRAAFVPALAALAAAVPVVQRQAAINDGQILNYALTLEHLEAAFYQEALQNFTEKDFERAGVRDASHFYNNLKEIAQDEQTHVSFLTSALSGVGVTPVAACSYSFGVTSVESFLQTANILEGVGVSAYLGAAQYIANKAYLTAAGSILTVEARHSAYLRAHQLPAQSPAPSPFDIPLDFDEVYSLAALFITSCPPSNPTLPVKAFPVLSLTSASPVKPNDTIKVEVASAVDAKDAYFVTITGPVKATLTGSGTCYEVIVPVGVQAGQEYLVLTSSDAAPTDDNIVAVGIIPVQDNEQGNETGGNSWGKKWNH